jgi:hypothetical protein
MTSELSAAGGTFLPNDYFLGLREDAERRNPALLDHDVQIFREE